MPSIPISNFSVFRLFVYAGCAACRLGEVKERSYFERGVFDQQFLKRNLDQFDVSCLFVDGIAERTRQGHLREALLAAWGITPHAKGSLYGRLRWRLTTLSGLRNWIQGTRRLTDPASALLRGIQKEPEVARCTLSSP